ncbi:MAG TPA: family 78 glycoside hydrolase catalytic domain, partial [Verrucomicrobiae bacterium]|nr:family 78 glycoside hydrolase catalytic domain [Verrucomicrobiae bacterium]
QTAYEILAASSQKKLAQDEGDLWAGEKTMSDETIQIPYAGKTLSSAGQVFWKVRVWDAAGKVSAWSKPATWTMGVLQPSDWHAHWIGAADTNIPSLLLRHEFTVKPGLQRALINVCGLGQYELTLNGKKAGDDFLSPGWTKFDRTCLYDTRDITTLLQRGDNAIGLELGNGMYNVPGGGRFTKFKGSFGPQKAIAQIRLEYADGTVEFIGTDDTWRVAAGPITFNTIYGGEDYDANLVQHGWNRPNFDDAKWSPALIVSGPGGELRGLSAAAPPIKKFEVQPAVSSHALTNGDIVYDLGQNAAHVPQISVTGPAGSKVRVIPSELLSEDGAANQGSMGGGHRGSIWCEYTKATGGTEIWSPKFFYVGCRYLQVHLTPAVTNGTLPKIKSIAGVVIQSASQPVGEFACSNTLFNRIRLLVRWAQRGNMVSLLTDCPHRERLGWLEEDHLNGPALRYEFDLAQLFTKTINDIADSQLTNGLVPTTAPEYTVFRDKSDANHLRNAFGDSPEWAATFILVPWQQYEFSGDLNLFRLHYTAMTNYLAFFSSRAENNIANYGLGDWYDVGPKKPGVSQLTPIALTATAFYFEDVKIMARVAGLLGKTNDAENYSKLAENIRNAFNEKFYDATNRFYATDSQCANAIPLVMDLCEPSNRAAVVEAIVRDVRSRGNALTAGDVGYRYLLRALADGGRSDVIFDINNQSEKPGYGMQLAKGKTSLTEAWDGGSSQDHFMLGQIQEWFYHDLAGIQSGGDGFKKIIIAPQPVGDVTWVKAGYDSIRGKIVSDWKRDGDAFALKITVPANTTATVYVPVKAGMHVTANSPEAKLVRNDAVFNNGTCAEFETGAGSYEFNSN